MGESQSNDSKQQDSDAIDLKRDKFINFLDGEINNLRTEIQIPGWTSWAICAAIAPLIWLLLGEIQNAKFNLGNVGGVLLVLLLLCLFYIYFKICISPSTSEHGNKDKLLATSIFDQNRLVLLALALLQVLALLVIDFYSRYVSLIATVAAYIPVGMLSLLILLSLILSFVRLPIPEYRDNNAGARIYQAVLSVIIAIALWYYLYFFFICPGSVTVPDIRIALIIAAIYILLIKFISQSPGKLTIESLTNIRREYFLGRIDFDSAVRQTDIALTGLNLSQYFEKYITAILSLYSEAANEYEKISKNTDRLDSLLSEQAALTKEQNDAKETLWRSIFLSLDKIDDIINTRIPKTLSPLLLRFAIIEVNFKRPDITKDLRLQLNSASENLVQRNSLLREKYDKKFKPSKT